jgi:F-type H+-transporting ATPase subunit gamma
VLATYPEKANADLALAQKITAELKELFLSGKTDEVHLLYTTFKAGTTGTNKIVPFLPLSYLMENKKDANSAVEYIYEPDFEQVFFSLLEKFLEGKIYLTLLESLTSEYNARMMAMKQANENGEEVLDSLKLLRNKTRQATITRELSEIVGGASVLV